MPNTSRIFAVCSCEGTMKPGVDAIRRGCGGEVREAEQLCGRELDRFKEMLGHEQPITVGCTQEAPVFEDIANTMGFRAGLSFANIRETGGWSDEGGAASPKMAALLAAASIPTPLTPLVPLRSSGVILIYGKDETAIEAGNRLKDILDVTVILKDPKGVLPPRRDNFPVAKGAIAAAKGHLGAFELTVDDFAMPAPSSRGELTFGAGRRGNSRADLILDLSGGNPIFAAPELRQGYVRADPRSAAAVAEAIFEVSQLVGEFDKPRFIRYSENLCAHERSKKVGCTRCLEVCPAGAITPNGNHVAISAEICMGCGQCAAVCPTGAAAYDYPPATALLSRLRAALSAYRAAGGASPVILFHDEAHGGPLIDMLARLGSGLPANVIPLAVNEITELGLETIASCFAYGALAVRFLSPSKRKHSAEALERNLAFADAILAGLGFQKDAAALLQADEPDALRGALDNLQPGLQNWPAHSDFLPLGSGRGLLKLALAELRKVAPLKPAEIALPPRAPVGAVEVDASGCTLCLSCVSVCPTNALSDNAERPMLRFAEDFCVQCGLCQATCPEQVISLKPRLNFEAWAAPPVVLKEEEPFHCTKCGKPFGVKSTIERITERLEDKHWMFAGENASRLAVLTMCEDCRVEAIMNESFDPHAAPLRPPPLTTEDYYRARQKKAKGEPIKS